MPKTYQQSHNPTHPLRKGHIIRKQNRKESVGTRSTLKYDQFFDFLKDLHCPEARRGKEGEQRERLAEITAQVMAFFNFCKHYSEEELDRQVIYFANLLNVIGEAVRQLKFEKEAKAKLRRFLAQLLEGDSRGKSKSSKMQALLYILAVLIYKEKVDDVPQIKEFQHQLYSDCSFVRMLLAIKLPKYKKIDKFYGVVLVHLSSQQYGKKMKQQIIRASIRNLPNVEHEATFFNFLVLLRGQKRKVKINIEDLLEANTMQVLMQAYPKHLHQYQSYYVLDYLTHLLSLFPCLASQVTHFFVAKLLGSSQMVALHHPLHECTIVNFVQMTLRYSQSPAKQQILKEVYDFLLSNRHFALKLAHIVIQHEIDEGRLMELLDNGYFQSFLELINSDTDEHMLERRVEVFKKIAENFRQINRNISDYLNYQLASRVKVIDQRRRNETM